MRQLNAVLAAVTLLVVAGCDGQTTLTTTPPTPTRAAASCPGTTGSNIATGASAGADSAGSAVSPPWRVPSEINTGLQKAGLSLSSGEGEAQHFHDHLDIVNDGTPIEVPAQIGIATNANGEPEYAPIHVHDTSGVIHVESPDSSATYTLGQFFDEWQVPLSGSQIGGLLTDSSNSLCSYVNGELFTGDPATIQLMPVEEIELYYGPVANVGTIISSYDDLAHRLPQNGPSG